MKKAIIFSLALLSIATLTTTTQAQVVPYYVEGSFVGNLLTLEAAGDAVGLHFGRLDFDVVNDANTGLTFDTQTASDGSQLILVRVDLEVEITDAGNGLFYISGVDYWDVVGGTGRFANAKSSGEPIVSTFITPDPVDLSNPVAIPAVFQKSGSIDLGRKKN